MKSRKIPFTPLTSLIVLVGLSVIFFVPTSLSSVANAQQAGATFTVLAGFEDTDADGLEIEAFLPQDIIVREGDTIAWQFVPLEPHTVTFLSGADRPSFEMPLPDGRLGVNPEAAFPSGGPEYDGTGVVNSGLVNQVPEANLSYSLTFTTAGEYEYVCLIHPFMIGTVIVLSAGDPYPFDQQAWDSIGRLERNTFTAEVQVHPEPPEATLRADGTKAHSVFAGISTQKADLMYFEESEIEISTGDTVTWSWELAGAPHTVTFFPEGEEVPPPILVEPQDQGPPVLAFNPQMQAPAGREFFEAGGFFNSGLLFNPAFGPPDLPGEYSLTFSEPGTFSYFCWLHAPQGMRGTITVTGEPVAIPALAAPDLPSVGGFAPTPPMGAVAAMLGLGLVLGGAYLIRRRAGA